MNFSPEQKKAIYESGSNIIVSAGAGSGKTEVLSERIINILNKGVNINNILVITFTNSAAREMKERIRKKLSELDHLRHLCNEVDNAKIMTFDSFNLYLVKKYHYVLNIPKDIKIGNSLFLNYKLNEILEGILNEYYLKNDQRLVKYFTLNIAKDDNNFKKNIINLYNKISHLPNSQDMLKHYMTDFYQEENINRLCDDYVKMLSKELAALEPLCENLYASLESEEEIVLENNLNKDFSNKNNLNRLENLLSFIKIKDLTYEAIKQNIDSFNLDGLSPTKGKLSESQEFIDQRNITRSYKDQLTNKQIKQFKEKFLVFETIDDIKNNILNEKDLISLFIEILIKLDDKYMQLKDSLCIYEFIDIAKLAIKLLQEHEKIKKEIKESLYEILIDEYQDTSTIQEYFINLMSHNNVYMVGDIKQSIYRFNNADPYIFKDKYEKYSHNSGGIKIDLNQNFRSRPEVLNNINLIFNKLMTLTYGDADYVKSHQMRFGLKIYEENKPQQNFNMEILSYAVDKNDDYKINECEGFILANDINNKIKNKMQIFDKITKKMRDIQYSDICILIDRTSNFELFKKILECNNIPLAINADRKVSDNEITCILISLIKIVCKSYQKEYDNDYYHALASVARSYLFQMEDEVLFKIIMESKKQVVPSYNTISILASEISTYINKISNGEIYNMILNRFEVLEKLPLLGDIKDRLIIIEYIKNTIDEISSLGENLLSICKFLNNIDEAKYSYDMTNSQGVKIMTIHKSKGLEFPVCYYPLLSSNFKKDTNAIGYSKHTGIYNGTNKVFSVIKVLGLEQEKREEISEKIRLFYVALTRAREKMIFIYNTEKNTENNALKFSCFNHMLSYCENELKPYIINLAINDLDINKAYYSSNLKNYMYISPKPNYNNTSYFNKIIEKQRISKEVIEVLSSEEQENIDLGLILHEYMENIDFINPDYSLIDKNYVPYIKNILELNPLFKNIKRAKTFREHEFIFNNEGIRYHGIIDLIIEYDDKIILIDYKLMNVFHEEYDRQVKIYKKYLETITKKPIKCYLLSLYFNKYRKVKDD